MLNLKKIHEIRDPLQEKELSWNARRILVVFENYFPWKPTLLDLKDECDLNDDVAMTALHELKKKDLSRTIVSRRNIKCRGITSEDLKKKEMKE